MTWLDDLSALAEKATHGRTWDEANFIAACSPERVRALCELAKACQPSRFMAPAEIEEALAALDALGDE